MPKRARMFSRKLSPDLRYVCCVCSSDVLVCGTYKLRMHACASATAVLVCICVFAESRQCIRMLNMKYGKHTKYYNDMFVV